MLRWRIVRQQAAPGLVVGRLLAEPYFAREFALLALPWLRIQPGLTCCKVILLKRGMGSGPGGHWLGSEGYED